ncbi:Pyruvate dehydrogenase complex repressor [Streptomyces sp. RB5]|uniref:Pyruvate dehydrogenase complex repressor n=1 Tax=Streptomyces smaragdinus TaxID=2585196 RepID=A0A7K0CAZ3_9ACTN|nr:GntR family transcriptional regulator [Streptomyces smaragdinus]MQY10627.1 Pyruvate dehydrogenase complex repressor [Streptomyces smaragdinus]
MAQGLTAASARRITRPAPLREAVSDALAELIVSGALEPGQHLVESDLADQLGVSRQPVREALQHLHTAGWVDLRPTQGAFVHVPTPQEATHLLGVRTVLETYSAQLAAQHAGPGHVERLWELHREGVDALAEGATDRLVAANASLHSYITSIGGNTVLAELIEQVARKVRWYYTPIANTRAKGAWNEHARLIRAIAKGDPERAGEIMRKHTERTRTYRKAIAAQASSG